MRARATISSHFTYLPDAGEKNFTSPGASSGEKRRTSSTFSACFALNERIEIAIPSFHMNSCFNMKR